MRRVAIFVRADPSGNPRPQRFIKSLEGFAQVDVFCTKLESSASFLEGTSFITFREPQRKALRQAKLALNLFFGLGLGGDYGTRAHLALLRWELPSIESNSYDVIFIFDFEFLALTEMLTGAFVFDMREYYPEQFAPRSTRGALRNRHAERTLRKYLSSCEVTSTVSEGLQSLYSEKFNVTPEVIESMPFAAGVRFPFSEPDTPVRVVHHGKANSLRSLGRIVEAVGSLPGRFRLDLFLVGKPSEVAKIKNLAKAFSNVRIRAKLPFDQILPTVAEYDLGLPFFPGGRTRNLTLSMPNKFFEYLRAGLPVICSPSTTEMSTFVRRRHVGFVSHDDSVESLRATLVSLDVKRIQKAKSRVGSMQMDFDWSKRNLRWIRNTVVELTRAD